MVGGTIGLGFISMVLVNEVIARIFQYSGHGEKKVGVTTAGICLHSALDGLTIGATLFCKQNFIAFIKSFL